MVYKATVRDLEPTIAQTDSVSLPTPIQNVTESPFLRVSQADRVLSFEVADDGQGFDPGRTSYGTGLQGIADRLAALGGTLEVRSVPGSGTALLGMVPVHATETAPG